MTSGRRRPRGENAPYSAAWAGGRFLPPVLGRLLVEEGSLSRGCDDLLYRFSDGVNVPDGDDWVSHRVSEILGDEFRAHHLREVRAWLACQPRIDLTQGSMYLNVRNGLLDWRAGMLLPHRPELAGTIRLPVTWDPAATCPRIDEFFRQALGDDLIEQVEEIAGLLLIPEVSYRKAFLFFGPTATGKSTLLGVLRALLGERNVSAVPLQALDEGRFRVAELDGRLANICGDLNARAAAGSGQFKLLVGGSDEVTAERKYHDPFKFRPTARLVFAANDLPGTWDTSDAWFDRWICIPMTAQVHPSGRDPGLLAALTTESELAGLLVRAVAGLVRLTDRGRFNPPALVQNTNRAYRLQADSVARFVDEECRTGPDLEIARRELLAAYGRWCHEAGERPVDAKRFVRRIRNAVPMVGEVRHARERVWRGLGLQPTGDIK